MFVDANIQLMEQHFNLLMDEFKLGWELEARADGKYSLLRNKMAMACLSPADMSRWLDGVWIGAHLKDYI